MSGIYIIAEAGVNHNGSLQTAKELVDAAKEAGADCVKFQTFRPEALVTGQAAKADYQQKSSGATETQLDMLKKLALVEEDFADLKNYCKKRKIDFLSTAFDLDSIDFLSRLGCEIWKIPSGEITNYPYLVKIARLHQNAILSTGMSSLDEVERAYHLLKEHGAGEITLLQCTTEYPAPVEDVNLQAMITMKEHFGCRVGYSDHTEGIEIAVAAAAMGASVIEKHFTLDKTMEGPDHKASLEPGELKEMIRTIRNVEKALGNGVKAASESERKNQTAARKSIVAKRRIARGEVFTEDNITTKRPGNGISPMQWPDVLGMKAIRDYEEDELIEL